MRLSEYSRKYPKYSRKPTLFILVILPFNIILNFTENIKGFDKRITIFYVFFT